MHVQSNSYKNGSVQPDTAYITETIKKRVI